MRRYIRKPHYYELDKMGIMHHSNIIRIMEEARVDLLFQLGINIYEIEKVGIVSPVTKVQCDYISMMNITVRRSRQSGVARATCPD